MASAITNLRARCVVSILSMLAVGNWAAAQERGPSPGPADADQSDEGPGGRPRFDLPGNNVISPGPRTVPTKAEQRREKDFRNTQALVGPDSQPPQGGPEGNRPANPLEMLERRMHELQQQQEQLSREYQAAVAGMSQFGPGPPQTPQPSLPPLEQQQIRELIERTKAELHQAAAPLPPDTEIRVFSLKYAQPEGIAQALHNITGGAEPRIAIDPRTNALLIAGNNKQLDVAAQLVKTLDQPSSAHQYKTGETVQLRVVWLIDELPETVGKAPTEPVISAAVLEALAKLGFDAPRVVCQQLTTLTIQDSRPGVFGFEVPVVIEGQSWQLHGDGSIRTAADDRYAVDFNVLVHQANNPQTSKLSGSIFTPLGHYTVMGTTTFVGTLQPNNAPPTTGEPGQHLSAFVVYLDRSPEFPASSDPTRKAKSR